MKDILILMWNCQECTRLKMNISLDKAFNDNPTGRNGQTLLMYYSFSNTGLDNILESFGMPKGSNAPTLKTHTNDIITDTTKIIEYMKANY